MAAPSTLALREIQPPAGRYVAHAPPSFMSDAGRARAAEWLAQYEAGRRERRDRPYKGARWTRPGYTGLDRVLPRAFAGLRAVST